MRSGAACGVGERYVRRVYHGAFRERWIPDVVVFVVRRCAEVRFVRSIECKICGLLWVLRFLEGVFVWSLFFFVTYWLKSSIETVLAVELGLADGFESVDLPT